MIASVKPSISKGDLVEVLERMVRDEVGYGQVVKEFNHGLKEFLNYPHVLSTHSHQSALLLILRQLGVSQGDEVIFSSFSDPFILEVVLFLKATPVFVDIQKDKFIIDMDQVQKKITYRTKAVIVSHFLGYYADIERLSKERRSYAIIEDCSHTFGLFSNGRSIGLEGDFGFFSFSINSLVSTLDGGAIISKDKKSLREIKTFILGSADGEIQGRLPLCISDLQAAMGLSELKLFNKMKTRQIDIAKGYIEKIEDSKLSMVSSDQPLLYNFFPVQTDLSLETIEDYFQSKEIEIQKPMRKLYFEKIGYDCKDFPHTVEAYGKTFLLPIYPLLKDKEIELIGKMIRVLK